MLFMLLCWKEVKILICVSSSVERFVSKPNKYLMRLDSSRVPGTSHRASPSGRVCVRERDRECMGGVLSKAYVEDCWSLRYDGVVECKVAGDALQHGVFLTCQQRRLCRALALMASSFFPGICWAPVLCCTVLYWTSL